MPCATPSLVSKPYQLTPATVKGVPAGLMIFVPLVDHPAADAAVAAAASRQQDAINLLRLLRRCSVCMGFTSTVSRIREVPARRRGGGFTG
jgi:hypothetical protein